MMQHAEIEKLREIRDQKKENAQKATRYAERRKVQEQGAGYQGYSSDTWLLIEQAENAQKALEAAERNLQQAISQQKTLSEPTTQNPAEAIPTKPQDSDTDICDEREPDTTATEQTDAHANTGNHILDTLLENVKRPQNKIIEKLINTSGDKNE